MRRLRNQLAIIIAGAWCFALVDSIATDNNEVLGLVTPVMLVVVTGLFALSGRNGRNGNGNGHDNGKDEEP